MRSDDGPSGPDKTDGLYQAPLKDFIANRNQLAADAKRDGDVDGSKRIKSLSKPSASAWAVNQVYWKDRPIFDALVAAGDRLRAAIAAGPSQPPSETDTASEQRQQTVADALQCARARLEEDGQNASDAVMLRVSTTFEALASYGSSNPQTMRGSLTEDMRPAGFGAFAGVTPLPPVAQTPPADPPPADLPSEELHRDPLPAEPMLRDEPTPKVDFTALEDTLDAARRRLAESVDRSTKLRGERDAAQQQLIVAETEAEKDAGEVAEAESALESARAEIED